MDEVGFEVLSAALEYAFAVFEVVFERTLENFVFVVVVGDFALALLLVVQELPLVDCVAGLQHSVAVLLALHELALVVVSVGTVQHSASVVDAVFYSPSVRRATVQMDAAVLILPDVLIVVAFVDIPLAVSISAVAVLLAVYEVPHILLPQVDQLEPALPVELGLLELPLVLCTQHAVAEAFEVAFAVVDAVFESTGISLAAFVGDFARTVELVLPEVAGVDSAVLAHEVRPADLVPAREGPFVAGAVGKCDFAVDEAVVPEEAVLLVVFGDEFASAVVLVIAHLAVVGVAVLLGEDGIDAVALQEVAFQEVSIAVVDAALAVLLAAAVDLALVVAAVVVGYLRCFCTHQSIIPLCVICHIKLRHVTYLKLVSSMHSTRSSRRCGQRLVRCGYRLVRCGQRLVHCGYRLVRCGQRLVHFGYRLVHGYELVNCTQLRQEAVSPSVSISKCKVQ